MENFLQIIRIESLIALNYATNQHPNPHTTPTHQHTSTLNHRDGLIVSGLQIARVIAVRDDIVIRTAKG